MSHPFGDLISQHLHRKPGLTQSMLATGINQPRTVVGLMCQGQRLTGPQARERVLSIIRWLRQQEVLETTGEANALLNAAGMVGLNEEIPEEAHLLRGNGNITKPVSVAAPKTAPSHRQSNLPPQLTTFIGREKERAELKHLLATTRLVTLTASGGCGKTRLAIQVASEVQHEYPHGVWFVDLALLNDPAILPQVIATVFQLHDQAGHSRLETLTEYLQNKQLLLILDNCEHLVDACASLIVELLSACPKLKILATSREALRVPGEIIWHVPVLAVPDRRISTQSATSESTPVANPQELLQYDSVRLFADRARTLLPSFTVTAQNAAAIIQICRQLDGIPLAIELAAARVKLLAVNEIALRLNDSFRLLTSGSRTALPRHQTLRAMIDWSYNLLSEAECSIFQRLAVFPGGCTIDAATAVCTENGITESDVLEILALLVDKSLILVEEQNGQMRYRMLEPVRRYALEKLQHTQEAVTIQARHLAWFLQFAAAAEPALRGPDQIAWFERIEQELENIREALQWSLDHDRTAALQLSSALIWFWLKRNRFDEGRSWLEKALAQSDSAPPALRVKALYGAGFIAQNQGYNAQATEILEQSLALARKIDDKAGISNALNGLGAVAWNQGNTALARIRHSQSLEIQRAAGDRLGMTLSLSFLGNIMSNLSDFAKATELYEEALALAHELGEKWLLASVLNGYGIVLYHQGSYTQARTMYEESLFYRREIGDKPSMANSLTNLGMIAVAEGNYSLATAYLEESLALLREIGWTEGSSGTLNILGEAARSLGDYTKAARYYEESVNLRRSQGNISATAWPLHNLGHVAKHQGDYDRATAYFVESMTIFQQRSSKVGITLCLAGLASIAGLKGQPRRAARLWSAAEALRTTINAQLEATDRAEYDRDLATTMKLLSPEEWYKAWMEGQAMPVEKAIAYAFDTGAGD